MITADKKLAAEQTEMLSRPTNLWADAMRRLLRNKAAIFGLVFIGLLVVMAILAPLLAPYDPFKVDFSSLRTPPTLQHLMGTDKQGRDILSRIVYGARVSMAVGFLSQILVMAIGLASGSLAGYYGGMTDTILMRLVDIVYAFPSLLFLILLMSMFGRGFGNLMAALALTAWAGIARLVRGQILQLTQQEFVVAAHCVGASNQRIIWRHLFPNLLGPLIVAFSFGVPGAIMAEAGLSFLGIGLIPPTPSWGIMLNDGFAILRSSPHVALFPGVMIALTMLAFLFLGDGLRDAFDPHMKR